MPIIMMSRPLHKLNRTDRDNRRMRIINETYENAKARGDKNVYFIDGSAFFNGRDARDLTPDLTHPNDEGYRVMFSLLSHTLGINE